MLDGLVSSAPKEQLCLENMSDILSLLRSTYNECSPEVSQCLKKTEDNIKRVLDEIQQMERRLCSLRVELRGLEWREFRYRSLLSPIRRVPQEILAYIFEFACVNRAEMGVKMSSVPAQISQVCATWRDLARSTPKLWSSLNISPASPFKIEQIKPFLAMHLELSKQSPLDLTVDMRWKKRPANEVVSCILRMLVHHSSRWTEVDLFGLGGFEEELIWYQVAFTFTSNVTPQRK
jgi:hypothetical protein